MKYSLAGGLVALLMYAPVKDFSGLSGRLAVLACLGAGTILGYMVSLVLDVFSQTPEEPQSSEEL